MSELGKAYIAELRRLGADKKLIRAAEIADTTCCPRCGQIDLGQTGEYPCPTCGLPTAHDEPPKVVAQ